jgi:hypothetical protein
LYQLSCINEMIWNAPKHEFWAQWNKSGAFIAENTTHLRFTNKCIGGTSSVRFTPTFV